MQAHGGFVQHIQGVGCLLAPTRDVIAHLGQLGHQLDPLRLTARERGRGLAQGEVAQSHVLEQLQRVADGGHGGKEFHRLVHFHLQHVADALAAPGDGQGLGVEARAVAGLARHLHIGQEAHGDGAQALALAGRTAPLAGVEGETPGAVAACLGFEGVGKELADGVPEADVGRRAGARGLTDRGLVHFEHAVDALVAGERRAADPGRMLTPVIGVAAGLGAALLHSLLHVV